MKSLAPIVCAALMLSSVVPVARAQEANGVAAYRELIDLGADGSAKVTVNITVSGLDADRIDLPMNVANLENLTVDGGATKVKAGAVRIGDVRAIRLQFEQRPPTSAQLTINFTAPKFLDWQRAKAPRGFYRLSYTFSNTTTSVVSNYALRFLLPDGYAIRGITSSTPRMTGEELEPPYDFATNGGRVDVNLRSKSVPPGRTAAIAFNFERSGRSSIAVIGIGIIIALLALYLKRDVLTRKDFQKGVAA